jgi:GDP/UDP-N,N'-diacetylbacillosamine 2-epimerase (hydrolysing)
LAYLSLIKSIEIDSFFKLEIIAFGSHLSKMHGFTINEIEAHNFRKVVKLSSLMANDDEISIATSYGLTALKFAEFWGSNKYDLVFCLGDRFEMSAAVQAGIPLGVKFAHIHGGETTLGAIDNIYRHQITIASKMHFVATHTYANKIKELKGSSKYIYNVGSLSLDELNDFKFVEEKILRESFGFPHGEYILTTFQPETSDFNKNEEFSKIVKQAISELACNINFVISMPNADTHSSKFREIILELKKDYPDQICIVESFGKKNYFSAMKYAKILFGNSSSGIIEAASFNKYVINVGNRQNGRSTSGNIINCDFNVNKIKNAIDLGLESGVFEGENIYVKSNAASEIISLLKQLNETL